jgi:hypothetical protein
MQDRLQLFAPDGRFLMWVGTHGGMPGQFNVLAGVAVDKRNRVFTTEQYHARVQMFRYTTVAEATKEWEHRKAEAEKNAPKAPVQEKAQGEQKPAGDSVPQKAAPEQKN